MRSRTSEVFGSAVHTLALMSSNALPRARSPWAGLTASQGRCRDRPFPGARRGAGWRGAAVLGPAGVRAGRALHLLFLVQPAVSGLSFLSLAQQAPPAAPAGALSSEAETTGREAGYAQS